MAKQRICAYCKKPISWLTGVLFNNCCSYKCDINLEKETKYGKLQSAPVNQNQHSNVALDTNFIPVNNEDEYDYGFEEDIQTKIRQNDIFYPQIEEPVDTFGFLERKKEPIEVKFADPYDRGEHYENKRSGYYEDVNGSPNYYDNGEKGFYSNKNPGYYDDFSVKNEEEENDIINNNIRDNDVENIEDIENVEDIEDNNSNDYEYYNEDEDYQITHNEDDQ